MGINANTLSLEEMRKQVEQLNPNETPQEIDRITAIAYQAQFPDVQFPDQRIKVGETIFMPLPYDAETQADS